jgi:predicted small metal-binding protein
MTGESLSDASLTVRCACGWETSGTEAEVVATTVDHGRRLHNMEATPEQVLAMAVPQGDPAADVGAGAG